MYCVATILCQWKSCTVYIIIKWSICRDRIPLTLFCKGKREKTPWKRKKERSKEIELENDTHAKRKFNLPWNCTYKQYAIRYAACNNIDSDSHLLLFFVFILSLSVACYIPLPTCYLHIYSYTSRSTNKFAVIYLNVCVHVRVLTAQFICTRYVKYEQILNYCRLMSFPTF